jgi:hypothetical protein
MNEETALRGEIITKERGLRRVEDVVDAVSEERRTVWVVVIVSDLPVFLGNFPSSLASESGWTSRKKKRDEVRWRERVAQKRIGGGGFWFLLRAKMQFKSREPRQPR